MANRLRILLLGASGTIGQILMRDLPHDIYPIYRRDCDLTDPISLERQLDSVMPHLVINCAMNGGKTTLGAFDQAEFMQNLRIQQNLDKLRRSYGYLINFGSGAEFDLTKNIANVDEKLIFDRLPTDSYGLFKNLTSRSLLRSPFAYTIRLFGCFDPLEPNYRLLRRFVDNVHTGEFTLTRNRKFSWISGKDLSNVVAQLIERKTEYSSDFNCAYSKPIMLDQFLKRWCKMNQVTCNISIASTDENNYYCNTAKMNQSNFKLDGLDKGLKAYK